MKLYLIRHGQSTGNLGTRLMGQSEHRLTPLGERQARAAAARLAPLGPMSVYASDLPRARSTAERIVSSWGDGAAAVKLDPRLREIALGDYEDRPWQDFEADEELTAAFAVDPYRTALPNGESLAQLQERVRAAVRDILVPFGVDETGTEEGSAEEVHDSVVATGMIVPDASGRACLVAHDGPIRAILNYHLGVPPEKWWTLSTSHGGLSLLEFAGGCVVVRYVNETGHLAGLEPESFVPSTGG